MKNVPFTAKIEREIEKYRSLAAVEKTIWIVNCKSSSKFVGATLGEGFSGWHTHTHTHTPTNKNDGPSKVTIVYNRATVSARHL